MSTQPRVDLKSSASISVSRNVMSRFGAKDLTALAATFPPVGRATAKYYQSEFREDSAKYVCAAPLATDVIDAATAAGHLNAPTSALKAETASRARGSLLAGAHRDLSEPLTAMLRLNGDWNVRGTDNVAVRIIEQQRRALEVMADLIDSILAIAEPEIARHPALLTDLASRSAGGKLREANATPEPRAEEWSAEWSMTSAVVRPEVPVAAGPASHARRVLLIDEDRGVLGALRIYLLCAGYHVFAAANADEALDRARMATSLVDIIITSPNLTGDDDGLAVIVKTRLLLGYNVPAVLLTTQTSAEIGKPALVADVFLLKNPVNLDELNALIGEVLERPRRSRLAHLRTTGAKLGHDEPNPEVVC